VLRKIFGPQMDKVPREWRRLHNEECTAHQIYFLSDQLKKNEMGRACGMYGRQDRCMQCFGEETCGKETTWMTWT
jgi:hypothetical protein